MSLRLLVSTVASLLSATLPKIAFAQTFKSVVGDVVSLIDAAVAVLVGVALLVFIFGAAQYVFQAGDKSAAEAGRDRMLAGVVGLFAIAVIWGLVRIVGATFGLV